MKKTFLIAALVLSQVAFALEGNSSFKEQLFLDIKIIKKQNVFLNITSSEDLKLTKSFKKDLITYLNKKYKHLNFTIDNNEENNIQIKLNLSNLSIKHFNVPKTETSLQMGVAPKKNDVAKKHETLDQIGVLSNSVIVFNSQIEYLNQENNFAKVLNSNFLISPDGINKNNEFISVNDIYNTLDFEFIDFIKQDYYINTQEVGFINGLDGSSGFSDNNINISNRKNDFKAKAIVFALVFMDIESILNHNVK